MSTAQDAPTDRRVETPSGRISYVEAGSGPVALFVHGVLLNKYFWRHEMAGLSDIRRCISIDLLAHGDTEIAPDQDVSVTANARMLREVLDALQIDQVDVIGNDSGGGIAQIFAALNPDRVRSLTLTNCIIDHKNEIQLATELMLYDKIAVPTPTDREGDDWKRWQREGWEPEKLMTVIDCLKPNGLVHEVKWDLSREASWRTKFEEAKADIETANAKLQSEMEMRVADEERRTVGLSKEEIDRAIANASYYETRSEIVRHLRGQYSDEDKEVNFWEGPVEFYAAYQSRADFEQLHPDEDAIQQDVERVNFLVQNRLAVPDESPEKLLDRVIGLVTDEEFKKRRRVFYDYQIDLLRGGHKPESVLKDLNQLVIEYNAQTLAKSEKYRWEIVTTVFVVAGAALSALPVFLSPASPLVGPSAIAGAFGAAGPAVWNTLRARKDTDAPQRIAAPGAMFHQVDTETGFQFLTSRGSPRK